MAWVFSYGYAFAHGVPDLIYKTMDTHSKNLAKRRNHLRNMEFARRAHKITSKKRQQDKTACRGWKYDR